jgi:uncharacterized lipoprotein YajG
MKAFRIAMKCYRYFSLLLGLAAGLLVLAACQEAQMTIEPTGTLHPVAYHHAAGYAGAAYCHAYHGPRGMGAGVVG